jgi:hypothetical protein
MPKYEVFWLPLPLRIREVTVSNLSTRRPTILTENFLNFPQFF